MNIQKSLPPTFRSHYRLFLRTASAAVLHHSQAKRNLRERWRPMFDAGAQVTHELQDRPDDASPEWIRARERWLRDWNKRLDGTLKLLYTSARSRGLPHKVTRNLGFMIMYERDRIIGKLHRLPKWDSSAQRKRTAVAPKELKAIRKKQEEEQSHNNANKALDEVIRMAEAFSGLTLGRNQVIIRKWPSHRRT
ncbi:hypothetical protein CPB84DRAFT_1762431 [Gymnopilus junonius]|uniref:Uncharacterized protein n=1 Tax=Gymnopilus junonius TaxID=109634 RepID=A0A9P5NZD3_GYMJU|nr:hypothetical protein CPB84DRAFT_1762431 [Gymnopilus junonius]